MKTSATYLKNASSRIKRELDKHVDQMIALGYGAADLHPENVMIRLDEKTGYPSAVVIVDFGISFRIKSDKKAMQAEMIHQDVASMMRDLEDYIKYGGENEAEEEIHQNAKQLRGDI